MASSPSPSDPWRGGDAYERYMGRWSRQLAPRFLDWLGAPPGQRWLDVGCGTGALSSAILERCAPQAVTGVDPSEGFLATGRMDLIRTYWDAAAQLDPAAQTQHQGERFPICQPEALAAVGPCDGAGRARARAAARPPARQPAAAARRIDPARRTGPGRAGQRRAKLNQMVD